MCARLVYQKAILTKEIKNEREIGQILKTVIGHQSTYYYSKYTIKPTFCHHKLFVHLRGLFTTYLPFKAFRCLKLDYQKTGIVLKECK